MLAEIQFGPFAIERLDSLVAVLLGFVLLVLLLWYVNIPQLSRPFLRDMLRDRANAIADSQEQVGRALEEAKSTHDQYARRIAGIETEARARLDAAVREAEAAHATIIAEAEDVARLLRRRSEEELARERARSRTLLRRQIVQTALEAAEQAVRDHVGDRVHRRLIRDFVTSAATDGKHDSSSVAARTPDAPARPEGEA